MKKRVLMSLGLFCMAALLMCGCGNDNAKADQNSQSSVKTSVTASDTSESSKTEESKSPDRSSKAEESKTPDQSSKAEESKTPDRSSKAEESKTPDQSSETEERSLVSEEEISEVIELPEESAIEGSEGSEQSEGLSEKDLADMEKVGKRLEQFTGSPEYDSMTIEQRLAEGKKVLEELADEGLIIKESIYVYDANISFTYSCGVLGGLMVRGFDPMMN